MAVTRNNTWSLQNRGDGLLDMVEATGGPAYVQALAPFDLLHITEAPQNGVATPTAASTAAGWVNPPRNDDDIIDPWSGGSGNPDTGEVYFAGGGHNDSGNNGIYKINFRSDPWGGYEVVDQSPIANFPPTSGTYHPNNPNDPGRPISTHTYGSCGYWNRKWIHQFGSNNWGGSGGPNYAIYDFDSGTWTFPGGLVAGWFHSLAVNPVTGWGMSVEMASIRGSWVNLADGSVTTFFRPTSRTNSGNVGHTVVCGGKPVGQELSFEVLWVGPYGGDNSRVMGFCEVDWTTSPPTLVSDGFCSISGDLTNSTMPNQPPLLMWDPTVQCYWMYGGDPGTDDYDNLYKITGTGTSRTVQRFALNKIDSAGSPGNPNEEPGDPAGKSMYNRGVLVDGDRCIYAHIGNMAQGPVVFKLPSS